MIKKSNLQPPLCSPRLQVELLRIPLLNRRVGSNSLCAERKLSYRQPTCVNHVSFVINLDALDGYSDVKADENGVWKQKGAPIAIVTVHRKVQNSV